MTRFDADPATAGLRCPCIRSTRWAGGTSGGLAFARVVMFFLCLRSAASSNAADQSQDWIVDPGMYYCMTYRMVGLHGEAADRFAGRINLTRDEQRFWVKIAAPDFDSYALEFCKTYPVVPNAKVSMIVWWNCAADSEATFSENKSIPPMRGNVKTEQGQYKRLSDASFFKIFPDLTYVLFDSYELKKRFYLEEGACEKL